MLLRIRQGHSPNCSSAGSVVGLAVVSAVAAGVLVNAWADRFARWIRDGSGDTPSGDAPSGASAPGDGSSADGAPGDGASGDDASGNGSPGDGTSRGGASGDGASGDGPARDLPRPTVRIEAFGAIVAWPEPPALLYVGPREAEAAKARGRLVGSGEAVAGALSAPTEVHVAVTERCPATCTGCYLDAGPHREDSDIAALDADLERLARMGVFEVALGGGRRACARISSRSPVACGAWAWSRTSRRAASA